MLRRLFQDSAVYTVATLFTTGLSFVLLPIYARVLAPSEYGLYDYVVVLGLIVGVTVAFEVSQAVMYYLARDADGDSGAGVIAAGFWVVVVCYGVFCLLCAMGSPWLADGLLGSRDKAGLVVVAALQFFAVALVRVWVIVERSVRRPRRVLAISVTSAALGGAFGVVGARSHGVEGLLLGQLAGQGLVGLAVTVARRRDVLRRVDLDVVRRLLAFSSPLVLSSVAFILAAYVDRLFVRNLLGLEALGYYGFGARIAGGIALLLVGFQAALSPIIYSELDREGLHEDVARVFRIFVMAAGGALAVLVVSADWVVGIVGDGSFAPAVPVVWLLAAAALIQGSYIFFPGLYIAQRTWTLAGIHVFGVLLNAGLNVALIHRFGLVGSGVATLVAAIAIFGLNYGLSRRYFRVPVLSRGVRTAPAE